MGDDVRGLSRFLQLAKIEGAHGLFVPSYCELYVWAKLPNSFSILLASLADNSDLIGAIDPLVFEKVIAEHFRKKGVEIEVTQSTRDGDETSFAHLAERMER